MLVKELIEKLKSLPENSQVVIEYTDHTDYHYVTPLNESEIRYEKGISGDYFDEDTIEYDEDGELKPDFENVVVITFIE
jgi:hypothetical protein